MGYTGSDLDSLLSIALRTRDVAALGAAVGEMRVSKEDRKGLYDAIAVAAAQRFLRRELSFEDADWIANQVYAAMIADEVDAETNWYESPPLAFQIYEAFDAGEYTLPGDGDDPAEARVRPAIETILGRSSDG